MNFVTWLNFSGPRFHDPYHTELFWRINYFTYGNHWDQYQMHGIPCHLVYLLEAAVNGPAFCLADCMRYMTHGGGCLWYIPPFMSFQLGTRLLVLGLYRMNSDSLMACVLEYSCNLLSHCFFSSFPISQSPWVLVIFLQSSGEKYIYIYIIYII